MINIKNAFVSLSSESLFVYVVFLAGLGFLVSCAPTMTDVNESDRRVVVSVDHEMMERTKQEWVRAGMPDPKDCLKNVEVLQLSAENFAHQCGMSAFMSIGCVQQRDYNFRQGKVIYLSPYVKPSARREAMIHLTLHAFCECTSTSEQDRTDEGHMRKFVFIEGGKGSIESLTRRNVQ